MLRIKRPYNGMQRIYDRDENGDIYPIVLNSSDGYSPKRTRDGWEQEEYTDEKTKEKKMKDKRKKYKLSQAKTFEVKDEAYVMERHGAILEKA